jgi:hypothetical protein
MPPESAPAGAGSDGARLIVELVDAAGGIDELLRVELRPHTAADALAAPLRHSLRDRGGQTVELRMRTEPVGNSDYDYVFVADPVLYTPVKDPPRIVLLLIDTLRADALGLYGVNPADLAPIGPFGSGEHVVQLMPDDFGNFKFSSVYFTQQIQGIPNLLDKPDTSGSVVLTLRADAQLVAAQALAGGGVLPLPNAARVARLTGAELSSRSCRLRPLSRGSRPRTGWGSTSRVVGAPGGRIQLAGSSELCWRASNSVATRLPGPAHTGVVP